MTATRSSATSVCIKKINNTGGVKKARNEKADKSVNWALVQHKHMES